MIRFDFPVELANILDSRNIISNESEKITTPSNLEKKKLEKKKNEIEKLKNDIGSLSKLSPAQDNLFSLDCQQYVKKYIYK